jgi:hypothetical protein
VHTLMTLTVCLALCICHAYAYALHGSALSCGMPVIRNRAASVAQASVAQGPAAGHPWNITATVVSSDPKPGSESAGGDLKQSPSVLSIAVQPGESIGVDLCGMKQPRQSHTPRTKLWRHLIQCPPLLVSR